jgi:hypothetical protein
MFFQFISYFKFLLKSTNQHGVHSPFVFDFVTKGLYKKDVRNTVLNTYDELKILSKKQQKILSKIITHFDIDSIFFNESIFKTTSTKKHKILFINNLKHNSNLNTSNLNAKHIILVNNIYHNKSNYQNWKKITQKNQVKVSIDLFYFGLLFFRKEQAKEHFTIRV